MTLIKSISGIRGTIGGFPGEGLTPLDLVKFTSAFAVWLKSHYKKQRIRVVVGRDARISGEMAEYIVTGTLMGMGADVIKLGFATTPTVEIAVPAEKADGGIILTASHNPKQWNALKLLNHKGEFIDAAQGEEVLKYAEEENFVYSEVDQLGHIAENVNYTTEHIDQVLSLPFVDKEAIKKAGFKIAVDAVNSVGGIAVPLLLKRLGVNQIVELYCDPTGIFPHNPEPLPEHLTEISEKVVTEKCDLGFVVDPDVDRLAIVCEDGSMFGEEYTLVAVADYVLSHDPGNTVSNLSSSRALKDITLKHGGKYVASAVGEVNVVNAMKENQAIIGGEGNGGVIYPPAHYGRDALVGIALFLSHLAKSGKTCTDLRKMYPDYVISKNKVEIKPGTDVDNVLHHVKTKFSDYPVNDADGVRIDFEEGWVHLRKSNTEPIIRIYAEAATKQIADGLARKILSEIPG